VEKNAEGKSSFWALRRIMLIFELFRWIADFDWHRKTPENG
jgi:hypothetical protein